VDAVARAIAYAPKLRPGEYFSHATALALAGGWIPDRLRTAVDVAVMRPTGRARGAGVRGHEATAPTPHVIEGLPCVLPVQAWCQAASLLSDRELVVAADALMRRHSPVLTIDALRDVVAARIGSRHVRRLRVAFSLARARTDSVAETFLRLDAADAGLPELAVNGEIRDAAGRFLAYGDLVHAPTKVLLEYDGQQHRLDDRQYARDVERLDALAAASWRVIRVNRSHHGVARSQALDRARRAMIERGWHP
jgi:very-short-patch-repair endonuclease